MADQSPQGRLQEHASAIAGFDTESLVHPKAAPGFDFEAQRPFFEAIKKFYGDVASAGFAFLPDQVMQDAAQVASRQLSSLTSIQAFNSKSGDPNQNQMHMVQTLGSIWQDSYNRIAPHLAFARSSSAAIAAQLQSVNETVAAAQKNCDTAIKSYSDRAEAQEKLLGDRANQLGQLVTAARETARTAAVAIQASEFDREARAALIASRWWIGWTGAAVILGLGVVWFMFLKDLHTPKSEPAVTIARAGINSAGALPMSSADPAIEPRLITTALVQQTVARILIVALVYAAVVWCARNYFASRHNYIVNRHRRNAMQTFQAFVAGSGDKATQDFILRQAALCAFSPQQTGYLKDESLPVPGPASQIIDVIKSDEK